jgi:PAP2 superfamily protein
MENRPSRARERRHHAGSVGRRGFLLGMLALGLPVRAGADGFPGGLRDAFGPRFGARPGLRDLRDQRRRHGAGETEHLRHWHEVALDATGLDHTPPAPGDGRVFGEQLGPGRASRAMAIVHTAVFDAMNAAIGGYQSYTGLGSAPDGTSVEAAIALAAHNTLIALFPSQKDDLDETLVEDLGAIRDGRAKANGIKLGQLAAAHILARRAGDGAERPEPRVGIDFITSDEPGKWRQDPVSRLPLALGAHWGEVRPFTLRSGDQFRVPPPPTLDSPAYAAAFNEVKALGGDGLVTPTTRTDQQTFAGIYWAYDGTPSLCAPPRLYNQIAMHIAEQRGTSAIELARLLALVNVAMADAGISIWESKYHYQFWRPVTGIREADDGTGPGGAGDGNPATVRDPTFTPLGSPASNLAGPNFTPPFPAYPSGHAGFGGALFQTLRHFYGTDRIPFTFVSDEFNGATVDNQGHVRPLMSRSFSSLSQAEEENGQSRIYLGIHWAFDKTEGIAQGREVADHVFTSTFLRERD